MKALATDKNKIYSKLKQMRGAKVPTKPQHLKTPVGTFSGDCVLDGFAADAEYLGRERGEPEIYDNNFYRLCKADNHIIFEFKGDTEIKIPDMSKEQFEEII